MLWIKPTIDDALAPFADRERDNIARSHTNYKAKCEDILRTLVAEVRGYVASNPRNEMDADPGTIPASLEAATISILRYRILLEFAITINESRTKDWEAGMATLHKVIDRKLVIASPTEEQPKSVPSPTYRSRRRSWGPERRRGIM